MLLFYLSLVDSPEGKNKLEQLYVKYKELMFYNANKILCDISLSEDAVHQSFINIMKNLDAIENVTCPQTKSYCVITCRRVALNMLRKEHREKYVDSGEFLCEIPNDVNVEEEIILKIEKENIINKISKLPNIYKDVLYLYYGNNLSLKKIAKSLKIPNETAKKRLQRARQQLFNMMQKGEFEL